MDFEEIERIDTRLDAADEPVPDLSPRTGNQLFRIVQEALNNSGKHPIFGTPQGLSLDQPIAWNRVDEEL